MKTIMKQANGFIETEVAVQTEERVDYLYKRLRVRQPEVVAAAVEQAANQVVYEVVTTEYETQEEYIKRLVDEAMKRLDAKMEVYRKDMEFEKNMYYAIRNAHIAASKERKKARPKNKVQKLMYAVGVDPREVYEGLCKVEERINKIFK